MAKDTKRKKPERFIVTTRWRSLSRASQIEEVRKAMAERHSNKSAARALGCTPGIVASIRWNHDIASLHEPSRPPQEKPSPGARQKLAASEATQCTFIDPNDDTRCGYERLPGPGSKRCALHHSRR